jgi:threonine aldolase
MRRAIAAAEVGDEQKREDPSVSALEERVADLLGHEAAVFVPTATMANQIALRALSEPGDEVIAEALAHVFRAELGGPAVHSGLAMRSIQGERGLFGVDELRDALRRREDMHAAPTRILCLENTHNGGGGAVWPLELVHDVAVEAHGHRLLVHLDGARLLNASIATGIEPASYGKLVDTVTLCLSKGLGCPLGALLSGSSSLMEKARRLKFLFGGAMRQAGIVAAAGLYALDNHVERLAEDHENARRLAEGLADAGLPARPEETESNIVFLDVAALGLTVDDGLAILATNGVLLSAAARWGNLRAVTHLDVNAGDIERAIEHCVRALNQSSKITPTAAVHPQ